MKSKEKNLILSFFSTTALIIKKFKVKKHSKLN